MCIIMSHINKKIVISHLTISHFKYHIPHLDLLFITIHVNAHHS